MVRRQRLLLQVADVLRARLAAGRAVKTPPIVQPLPAIIARSSAKETDPVEGVTILISVGVTRRIRRSASATTLLCAKALLGLSASRDAYVLSTLILTRLERQS